MQSIILVRHATGIAHLDMGYKGHAGLLVLVQIIIVFFIIFLGLCIGRRPLSVLAIVIVIVFARNSSCLFRWPSSWSTTRFRSSNSSSSSSRSSLCFLGDAIRLLGCAQFVFFSVIVRVAALEVLALVACCGAARDSGRSAAGRRGSFCLWCRGCATLLRGHRSVLEGENL